ncbi:phospholipase [Alteribacter lacisalsi]|uniref:Phospholipase n=1 Tax=Alteribacter lacisalsi TaxID=2045244 RepID=A0A2W0H4L2_9BACI|nr:phospholipase [Alteribacter lacisalsi]
MIGRRAVILRRRSKEAGQVKKGKIAGLLIVVILLTVSSVSVYGYTKPQPEGVDYAGAEHRSDAVEFLYDLTYEKNGRAVVEQNVYDRMLSVIEEAGEFVVVDMFLYNNFQEPEQDYPDMAGPFTEALVKAKETNPDLTVYVMTDEINRSYGAHKSPHIEKLREHGIEAHYFDNSELRDPAPAYSGVWRTFLQWWGKGGEGWIPNAQSSSLPDVPLRSYLEALNLKGNHRKLVFSEKEAIVTSLNAQGRGAYNSNFAFSVQGAAIGDLLFTERVTADMSGVDFPIKNPIPAASNQNGAYSVQVLTEKAIKTTILEEIEQAEKIDVAAFYLSDRDLVKGLIRAAERGIPVRIILDPNIHAFGREKPGIPNQVVAHELREKAPDSLEIRWYNTAKKEQYHTKLFAFQKGGETTLIGGAANFTKRNIGGFNLETNLKVSGDDHTKVMQDVQDYFDRLWTNEGGKFTQSVSAYEEDSWWKHKLYILQERTGFSTY